MPGLTGLSGLSGPSSIFGGAFIPSDIDGLILWLKADAGVFEDSAKTTPATDDGDVIGAWADQSGNGNDATQGTTANKPTLRLNVVNGLPVIRFDGTNDILTIALDLGLGAIDNLAIFFVVNPVDTASSKIVLGNQANAGNRQGLVIFHNATENLTYETRFNAGNITSLVAGTVDINFVLGSALLDSGTQELYRNGSLEGSGAQEDMAGHDASLFIGINRSGGGARYEGDMAEIILYNVALSNTQQVQVETYLNERYAIF